MNLSLKKRLLFNGWAASLPWLSYEKNKHLAGKVISVFECGFVSMAAMLTSPVSGREGVALTFIQPITEPVEDAALFAGGHQPDGSALHRRAIVDVVFKNEDLQQGERSKSLLFGRTHLLAGQRVHTRERSSTNL